MGEKQEPTGGGNLHTTTRKMMVLVAAVVMLSVSGCQHVEETRGYLSKGPPVALRFDPPEPYVVELPPLPKTSNPQPELLSEVPAEVIAPSLEEGSTSVHLPGSRAEYQVR